MELNYDNEIKKIFENKRNKKNNNDIINKKEYLNNELLTKNDENIININNYNDNNLDLKSKELINKLKNFDKKEKEIKLKLNKEEDNNFLNKKISFISESQIGKFYSPRLTYKIDNNFNNFFYKNLSDIKNQNKKLNKSINKYERYNTENIKYDVIKNYCQYKLNIPNFLDRMKFYSIKKKYEDDFLNLIVEKTKPKIKESEKIKILNNLINDSNRRIKAKNRIEIYNTNYKFKSELNRKKSIKKKFNEKKFLIKYKENVIDKLEKRKRKLEELRKKQNDEKEKKENEIIEEMKKRIKKVSKRKIENIS